MNNDNLTSAQAAVLETLERRGYRVNRIQQFDGDAAPTVFLSRKPVHYRTLYAEIDADASVNGMSVASFLNTDK